MSFNDLDQDVRAKLFLLVTGLLPLRDFQVWFAPVAWRLGRPENAGRFPLTRHTELSLAEYTSRDWSEVQVLGELASLLRPDRSPVTMAVGFGNKDSRAVAGTPWYMAAATTSDGR
jgi:hypothetical protein